MTTVYEVQTKHTKDMLMNFIRFSYKVNHPKSAMRMLVLGIGALMIGVAAIGHHLGIMIGGFAVGGALLLLLLFRRRIAFGRLSRRDPLYQNGGTVDTSFGQAQFLVRSAAQEKPAGYQYAEVDRCYKDKGNYYLLINNQDLQILPFQDFQVGSAAQFEDFLFRKTDKQVINLAIPFKEKLKMLNQARKQVEQNHDQQVAEKRKK